MPCGKCVQNGPFVAKFGYLWRNSGIFVAKFGGLDKSLGGKWARFEPWAYGKQLENEIRKRGKRQLEGDKKTIPGSLIAQGLSGLNGAKIHTFFEIARVYYKKIRFS